MMNAKDTSKYTPQQLADAERFMQLLSRVPEDKRDAVIQNTESVIIGIEIAVMFPDPSSSAPLWLACVTNGISVGIGELISCTILGVALVKLIETKLQEDENDLKLDR